MPQFIAALDAFLQKHPRWARVVGWSAALFGVLPLVVRYCFGGDAVLWYTVETADLRRETVRHNAIAIQPVLVMDIGYQRSPEGKPTSPESLLLRNVGQGPALHVQIDPLVVDAGAHLYACFFTPNVVSAGEEVLVDVRVCVVEAGALVEHRESFLPSLKRAPVGRHDYDVMIRYEDLARQPTETRLRMGASGVQFLTPS